jgi:hypothetical protein
MELRSERFDETGILVGARHADINFSKAAKWNVNKFGSSGAE